MRNQIVAAMMLGLALRLFFIWRFPLVAPDTAIYDELARNWLDHGIYGLFVDGRLIPVDIRVPGYPAFLAAVYALFGRAPRAVMLAQALLDLMTCGLTAVLGARLASPAKRARVATAALWLAALCPFTANYTAVPLTEVLATFLTALALVFLLTAYAGAESSPAGDEAPLSASQSWFLGGFIVGLGTLVRPETPLLLAAVAAVLVVRWRRVADWPRLIRTGACLATGLVLPLLPWAARNWHTLGRVQFLAPRYAEMPREYVPRGFYAWTKTWLVRYGDVYLTVWKLGDEPIPTETLPAAAFDSPAERERVAALLDRYNAKHSLSPALDREFAQLARERAARYPLRTYLWIPLQRAATLWFTPRIELLPYSGHLRPLAEKWEEDPQDFLVTVGFGLLNFVYVGLAVVGAWYSRRHPELTLMAAVLLVRTAFLTQVETPEPRYVIVCFPVILTLAALVWARPPAALVS